MTPAVLDRSAVITQHTYNGETLGKRIADLPVRLSRVEPNMPEKFALKVALSSIFLSLSGRREREPFRLSPSCSFAGYIRGSGSAGIFLHLSFFQSFRCYFFYVGQYLYR